MRRGGRRLLVGLLGALAVGALFTAVAAANSVPASRAGGFTRAVTANDLKPPECAALNLTTVVAGTGTFNGTGGAELIVGSPVRDVINGNGGGDCIVGGAGNDDLRGGSGTTTDILMGGPGDDVLRGGNGNDFLYGGAGNDDLRGNAGNDYCNGGGQAGDTFSSCETVLP